MHQEPLFFERMEDAMAVVVEQCGGRKKFAVEMFPDKPPRDAHNLLDAMFNAERREKFSPSQILYIAKRGRDIGCHVVMLHICREAGYADPIPVTPKDVADELQRQYIEAARSMARIAERIETLQRPALRAA